MAITLLVRRICAFKLYQGTFAPRLCHMASVFQGARDDTRKKAEQSSEGSDSTQPQTSLLVPICSGQRACRTAGVCRSGAGLEATRLLAETESKLARSDHFCSYCCAQQQQLLPEAHISYTGLCGPGNTRGDNISPSETQLFLCHNSARSYRCCTNENRSRHLLDLKVSSKHRPSWPPLPRDEDWQIAHHVQRLFQRRRLSDGQVRAATPRAERRNMYLICIHSTIFAIKDLRQNVTDIPQRLDSSDISKARPP